MEDCRRFRRSIDVTGSLHRLTAVAGLCLAFAAGLGCGSEPSGPGADTGTTDTREADSGVDGGADTTADTASDVDDGSPDCRPRDDGGCGCLYDDLEKGVCGTASRDPSSGQCAEPDDYESMESSCADGLDNDCDGLVDCEDPDCVGRTCESGTERTCPRPDNYETDESTCDGIDNDCDGEVDEECQCNYDPEEVDNIDTDDSHDSGVCAGRELDEAGECTTPETFESRTDAESNCDEADNDCDGSVDEGCPCVFDPDETNNRDTDDSHNAGVCAEASLGASGEECLVPSDFENRTDAESNCDGLDNDCDGVVDEGCSCIYDPDESDDTDTDGSNASGVCLQQAIQTDGTCGEPADYEAPEQSLCNDGLDNDCDGTTDEPTSRSNVGESCQKDCDCAPGLACNGGTCAHVAFLSSKVYNGSLGGVAAADRECNALASAANLGGTWRAILSDTSTDARDRLSIVGSVVNRNGDEVATGSSDLWDGDISNPIEYYEDGRLVAQTTKVWTGSTGLGTEDCSGTNGKCCSDWTNTSTTNATVGSSLSTGQKWLNTGTEDCFRTVRLYCVSGQ